MKTFKIGSGELDNYLLLDTINEIGEKVILSSGLSNYEDLDNAINRFNKIEKQNISTSILHHIQHYLINGVK